MWWWACDQRTAQRELKRNPGCPGAALSRVSPRRVSSSPKEKPVTGLSCWGTIPGHFSTLLVFVLEMNHSYFLLLQWGIIKAAEGPEGVKTHRAQENISQADVSHGCSSISCPQVQGHPHSSHQPSPTGRKHRSITRNSGFKSFIFKT